MNDIAPAGNLTHDLSNAPPLAEQIAEDTKPLIERRDTLLQSLRDSHIANAEDAAAVTSLGVLLKDLRDKVEAARKEAARPFDEGKATVQRLYARDLLDPLDAAMTQARNMLNSWRRQQEAAAEAERRKRDEEAAAARAAAEKLAQDKRDAEAAGDPNAALKAELAEIQARDRAEALESDEGVIRPDAVLHTQVGAAISTTRRVPVVTNIGACLKWLLTNQPGALLEAIAPLLGRLTRAKVVIPGVDVRDEQGTSFRR
jgi:hypothetical protein